MTGRDASTADSADRTRVPAALQALRLDSGAPSYAEIAARVSRLRSARGTSERAAAVARSTVYDAFRPDRKRWDAELVADIVLALGGSDEEAARWRRRCADANLANQARSVAAHVVASPASRRSAPAPLRAATSGLWTRQSAAGVLLALALLVALNVAGGHVVLWLGLPVYLDMIGTAVAAFLVGPWCALLVAIVSQAAGALLHQSMLGVPFTAVAVAGALLWGYGVHAWGLGRSIPRFFTLNVLVAVACTLVAAPITVLGMGGFSAHTAGNALTEHILALGDSLGAAVFGANLVTSLLDKLIAGFTALTIGMSLARRFRARVPALEGLPLLTDVERRALRLGAAVR
ncbi:hypothetical protein [Microbacterium sp. SORGH_AS_0888]|uniref:hypothetical protein n=1 Tax=Microbacterium sp. SORGH_AS_0888 TaxID=3041791 RepID=UPI0027828462|nr:hypothetical protein [Microbacterium sp. SORGH_AS_0888]MDQ1130623.1 energy-coupling factor transport system substrate-specific component [Microbacterium sp. SORGH_AS_0888]